MKKDTSEIVKELGLSQDFQHFTMKTKSIRSLLGVAIIVTNSKKVKK